jgi:hypothetical protein
MGYEKPQGFSPRPFTGEGTWGEGLWQCHPKFVSGYNHFDEELKKNL